MAKIIITRLDDDTIEVDHTEIEDLEEMASMLSLAYSAVMNQLGNNYKA